MTEYNYALKKQIVEAYQGSEGGYKTLTDRYSIPASYTVKNGLRQLKHSTLLLFRRKKRNKVTLLNSNHMLHTFIRIAINLILTIP
ncbi:hypothetical protein CUM97_08325 [Enterococcus mundtii]|nr:hypothetical protein AX758_06445 [Enterococcus mundtii]PQC30533.1 hypothetical protein CUM97_08325 [Enterococcus mundtii]